MSDIVFTLKADRRTVTVSSSDSSLRELIVKKLKQCKSVWTKDLKYIGDHAPLMSVRATMSILRRTLDIWFSNFENDTNSLTVYACRDFRRIKKLTKYARKPTQNLVKLKQLYEANNYTIEEIREGFCFIWEDCSIEVFQWLFDEVGLLQNDLNRILENLIITVYHYRNNLSVEKVNYLSQRFDWTDLEYKNSYEKTIYDYFANPSDELLRKFMHTCDTCYQESKKMCSECCIFKCVHCGDAICRCD